MKNDTKLLVDSASNFDLHIYDRFHGTDNRNKFTMNMINT